MANEDMDGTFLGGGGIDHVIEGGEVYLNAYHLATLLMVTGSNMGMSALALNDVASGVTAHMVLHIADKLDELRSELLKREAEAMLPDMTIDLPPEISLDELRGLFGLDD